MSFLSFNVEYYLKKVERYETAPLSKSDIYEAKQLLKLTNDLADEGYFELFNALQRAGALVDRLKAVIVSAGERPFYAPIGAKGVDIFRAEQIELSEYSDGLVLRAQAFDPPINDRFLPEIQSFCRSIEYDKNSSYVFLLRDCLLPYIYFKRYRADNIYPYLIGRSFTDMLYKNAGVDDRVRAVVFDALEAGKTDFKSFLDYCKAHIKKILSAYPDIATAVKRLLSHIQSRKIVVIETGVFGTFPLLLSALDDRIEFKMYTTAPYLFDTYKNNIFTTAYENIRMFETLDCSEHLFKLTGFKDDKFYVSETADNDIIERSLCEINYFLK